MCYISGESATGSDATNYCYKYSLIKLIYIRCTHITTLWTHKVRKRGACSANMKKVNFREPCHSKIGPLVMNLWAVTSRGAAAFLGLNHIVLLPEASFGLRVLSSPASVCVSVCQSVCQSLAYPRDNLGPVQARIAKFGPKMQKTLVKVIIVLEGNWSWPSRSNWTSKSEFTPFWACPDHNSSPIQVRITKCGPEVENSLVKVPIILGGNWPMTFKVKFDLNSRIFYQTYLRCFCKHLVRPSPVYI